MPSIRNILVLYHRHTGDEAALERAVSLAHRVGGSVIVSETLDRNDAGRLSWFMPPSPRARRAWERFLAEREAHFHRLLASTRRLNVPVRCKVLVDGPPCDSVIRTVVEDDVDLVIVTGADVDFAGAGARRGLVAKLVRKCPCPVWVVDPVAQAGLKRMVAAIDLPEHPGDDHEAAARVLRLVGELNAIEQCRVDILHAWDFTGAERDRAHSEIPEGELRRMVDTAAEGRRGRIAALIARSPLDETEVAIHVERGSPNFVIPDFVARHRVDLVVMGSGTGSSLKSLFVGSIAREVFEDAPCSVLAVGNGRPVLATREHPLA